MGLRGETVEELGTVGGEIVGLELEIGWIVLLVGLLLLVVLVVVLLLSLLCMFDILMLGLAS